MGRGVLVVDVLAVAAGSLIPGIVAVVLLAQWVKPVGLFNGASEGRVYQLAPDIAGSKVPELVPASTIAWKRRVGIGGAERGEDGQGGRWWRCYSSGFLPNERQGPPRSPSSLRVWHRGKRGGGPGPTRPIEACLS